ncbi:hypothetical protein BKA57DRAFT_176678 [Linnemannia elongata]|nr:hypothetical protein BKA57DRAFT_176678 [Linnemannia elongata]
MYAIATPNQNAADKKTISIYRQSILSPFSFLPFLVLVVLLGLTRCDEGWTCSGLGALTFDLLSRFVNISCLAQSVLSTFLLSILVFSFIVVFYSVNIFSLYFFFFVAKKCSTKV